MRSRIFLSALLLSAAPALAQSDTPNPGVSPGMPSPGITSNDNTTVSIVNSTAARMALTDAGFTEIISLKPGLDGWVAEAVRDGREHTVTVDEEDGSVEVVK